MSGNRSDGMPHEDRAGMSPGLRRVVFLAACPVLLPCFVHVAAHMPTFGAHPLPFGELLNHVALKEWQITNVVSAVNFDYRGFDTLGEEFMLLSAVTGTSILLRGARGEVAIDPQRVAGRRIAPRSGALILACRLCGASTVLFALYVAAHGMATPGDGFQAGAFAATGFLVVFLGEGYHAWGHIAPSELLDAFEGGGRRSTRWAASAPWWPVPHSCSTSFRTARQGTCSPAG